MNKIIINLIMLCLILSYLSCKENRQESKQHYEAGKYKIDSMVKNLIADTIIYDVIIRNPDPNDKWTEKCLAHFDRSRFVDQLFDAVYDKHAIAYDFFSGKKITPGGLKRIERSNDFSREKIGKIQFSESWYYDSLNLVMKKRIISLVLGYELFGDNGEIIGYKPVFKIDLN
jgi:hypothetical protein